jgi:hypothetical protein
MQRKHIKSEQVEIGGRAVAGVETGERCPAGEDKPSGHRKELLQHILLQGRQQTVAAHSRPSCRQPSMR